MIKYFDLSYITKCIFCGNPLQKGGYLTGTSERTIECRNDRNYHVTMLHSNGFALRTQNLLFSNHKNHITFTKIRGDLHLEDKLITDISNQFSTIDELIVFMRNDFLMQ